ncbi:FYN-binding protein 1 [Cheilinus undulatus]|uniref:FYN-binding protein 1 n=1 Tax=Cheilinus undulatus TaxID=241271 RepID=UPI001BD28E28|nr:FYN-binding protein 1 [Cheilinus undulatus]
MEESVDFKALRARFNNKANTSDTSSRDSGSPKSPRPNFERSILQVTENNLVNHRLPPTVPPPTASPGLVRFPRQEQMSAPPPSRPAFAPRLPPNPGLRPAAQPADVSNVRQTGEMLQHMMLRHQRPPGPKPSPAPAPAPAPSQAPVSAHASVPPPLRQQPRQRSTAEVTPLRRPLPPEGPLPLKPKRPPNVNLEPFMRPQRGPALPAARQQHSSPGKVSSPALVNLPKPPQRTNKPKLPHQVASVDIQDTYDDVGSFEKSESWSDNSSHCLDGDDDDDVYESIDEDQVEVNRVKGEKKNKKEAKKQREQEKKEQMERQKKENTLKKNFQLKGEVEVLHTARVRHDWNGGGKLDLSVQQGESVEIIRVKNNPGGKWLARSLDGNYGYISNTCVDVDYEAVKRKLLQSRKPELSPLPPPPPDPPQMLHVDSNNRDSMFENDDDYDDVQTMSEDFPPPPPEISIDPKIIKELRKKFKYEGTLNVLHTMMVDPNSVIKKPGANYLQVTQGEVLDIIELTNNKKALCRNQYGKYGYVSRSLLLPMEGDIYDDVDYGGDIYDNDSPHINH